MIAFLSIQRFYVRTLGLEFDAKPAVVVKDKRVLDLNVTAMNRRVSSAMSSRDAKACLMGGVFRDWNSEHYVEAQKQWLSLTTDFSDVIEPDEQHSAWIDLSGHPDPISTYRTMLDIIPNVVGGISDTKWLAKLAAQKNDVEMEATFDPVRFISQLTVSDVSLIQAKDAERLDFLGYASCGKAQSIPLPTLQKQFGEYGLVIWNALRGEGGERVKAIYPERTVADRMLFPAPIEDLTELERSLFRLSHRLAHRLQREDSFGSTLTLMLLNEESVASSLCRTFTRPLFDRRSIYVAAKRLFDTIQPHDPISEIRLSLTEVQKKHAHQQTFDQLLAKEKKERADTALKCVRRSFGDNSIKLASEIQIPRRQKFLKEWRDATGWV